MKIRGREIIEHVDLKHSVTIKGVDFNIVSPSWISMATLGKPYETINIANLR